jgi:hypothetical protein
MDIATERVLAIELRVQRFGFVLWEHPGVLLDWGVSGYHTGVPEALDRKISYFADKFAPFYILCRERPGGGERQQILLKQRLDVLRKQAEQQSILIRLISASTLRKHFQEQGRNNKYEVSQIVATYFPELAWRLPAKRKPWQSEPLTQALFDAAMLAVFHSAEKS